MIVEERGATWALRDYDRGVMEEVVTKEGTNKREMGSQLSFYFPFLATTTHSLTHAQAA